MENSQRQHNEVTDSMRGLPMFSSSDPEALAAEKDQLSVLQSTRIPGRWWGYFKMTGPGWLQSAMTLGGGSAMASLFAGAFMQYKLLWVQPLAMILGIIMLSTLSYQTLSTGVRPFHAMKKFIHPSLAWIWAIASLLATIIWHFPQYALAAGMTDDMIKAVTGWNPTPGVQTMTLVVIGLIITVISVKITWSYGSGRRGIRIYENALRGLVWMVIFAFLLVVIRRAMDGGIEWGKVFKGFLPMSIPTDRVGVTIVMAAFGAAVGINMTFLFPYTLLARGWGKEHRRLSQFDLLTGTLLPYCLATSLMIIATGCTIYDPEAFATGSTRLDPTQAAAMLQSAGLSMFFSRIVFGLGILGMTLSTITLHMLVSGFIVCELFGIEPSGWRYKLACLIPLPGFAGVVIWQYMGPWIAVPASAISGLLIPIAYTGFFILNNSKKYLESDKPVGKKAIYWNIGIIVAILVSIASGTYFIYTQLG